MGGCTGVGCSGSKAGNQKWDMARIQRFCRNNWRCLLYLTVALAAVSFGIIIAVQGLQESLSKEPYVNSFLGLGGIGQMWVLGPTLMLCGTAIAVVALVMRKKESDKEFFKQMNRSISDDRNPYTHREKEEAPEEQAVPMEPIIFLL